jgi:hypothetical protein
LRISPAIARPVDIERETMMNPIDRPNVAGWACWREPMLKELLSEPLTMALMDADDVDREELGAMFQRIAAALRSRSFGSQPG